MRRLMLGLAMATLVMARPELYKEKEDFQYSRSSSDDGTKAGYYDAQRGNMGGNYERAHNMDPLAQHQMGGLVRQVEGELGDGSKTRTGNVFSSANSRGVYGSGHYDLSNLAGRNFQEGLSYRDSQSASSSLSNSAHTAQLSSQNNARYSTSGRSLNSNYRGYEANNLQATQNLYNTNQFEQGMQAGHHSQYHSQSGYEGQNSYQQRVNTDHLTAQNVDADTHHHRLISTVPVKIIVRPGQSIAVPIATQTHSGSQIASYYDQNAVNTDAEVLRTNVNQQAIKPSNSGKHYESSYSYRKEWEKHDVKPAVIPLSIPTLAPIPKNSELYDDSYLQRGTQYADNRYEQNTNLNSASSHSQHQTDFNAQHRSSASSNTHLNSYDQSGGGGNSKFDTQSDNLIGTLSSKPKSYQSSYSYHKAWERQGDPYVIKPATNGIYEAQTSDRLTDASNTQSDYSSYNYGSRKTQNQQYVDCDTSHTRVARSYNSNQDQLEQQSQNSEDLGQLTQNQWDNMADLGQQTQDQWTQTDNFGQQTLNKENLEDLGQQTQNQWENLSDLGQQTQDQQTQTDNFEHQTLNKENLEDLGQQTQDKWDNLAELGQQTQESQDQWTQTDNFGQQMLNKENLEDLSQQTQNKWDNLADHGQQTQENFTQTDNFGQQTLNKEHKEDLGQQTQNKWDNLAELGQQTQDQWTQTDNLGQQTLNKENLENFSQQTQDKWGQTESDGQQAQNKWDFETVGQQTQSKWDSNKNGPSSQSKLEQYGESQMDHDQQTQDNWGKQDKNEQSKHMRDFGQQSAQVSSEKTPSPWDKLSVIDQTQQLSYNGQESAQHTFQHDVNQQSTGTWDVMHNYQSFHGYTETQENSNAFHSDHEQNQHGNTGSLSNLWGKLDNLDDDYSQYSRNNDSKYFTQSLNSQHFNHNQQETFHHSISNDNNYKDFVVITHKQENITEKSPTVSDDRLTENVKFTTPKVDTEKNNTPNILQKNYGEFTIKTEKPQPTTNIIRPIDVGRGDIGPEESLIEASKEPNNIDISNQKEQNLKNNENHKTYHNLDQEFDSVDEVGSDDSKFESSTSIVFQFSKDNEEMTTEVSSAQDMPQELETMINNEYFGQNKGFEQENKQFIDSMKDFESQNTYQQTSADDDFSQQNKELGQQSNWNDESQNVEQQFVNDFNEQIQSTAQSSEQQFENFGQKHDTIVLQSQQMNKHTNLEKNIPQEVNESRVIEEQVAMYKEPSLETFNKPNVANNPEVDIPEENEPKVKPQNTNIETVAEKPGFWKSVGSKLSNVKSKVASWFGS